ncbi:MAG: glycosyltransferase [Gemmatimonadaceae bacterium]
MRIMHVVAPAEFGGLESVVLALASGQQQRHDVHLLALLETDQPETMLSRKLRQAGTTVHVLRHAARSFQAQRRDLSAICDTIRPDIIHTHGYLPDVLAASIAATADFARVSTVHGFTGGSLRNRSYEMMQRAAFFRFDSVVAVSRKLAGQLESAVGRSRVRCVPNAFVPAGELQLRSDARQQLGLDESRFQIAWIGRISDEKGPDVFVDALGRLDGIPFHATIIGDGPSRPTLEIRSVEALGADRISWTGQLADASNLLAAFDLLVMSSRTEGTPIVLFEAMHAGLPVVAAAVGGIPDVISSAEGLLFPREDAAGLADCIKQVHGDRPAADARAASAKARLDREFAPAPWLDRYDEVYTSALSRRQGS